MNILDSSAMLAFLFAEKGSKIVSEALKEKCYISSINHSEVIQKIIQNKADLSFYEKLISDLELTIQDFTGQDAKRVADIYQDLKPVGASLADRACIAFGLTTGFKVYTADKGWANHPFGRQLNLSIIR